MSENTKDDQLFMELVLSLQSSAWMLMGKVANPMSGEVEVNLEGACATIDMIEMLKNKTKGNISEDAEKVIGEVLTMLRLNYVQAEEATPEDQKHKHNCCCAHHDEDHECCGGEGEHKCKEEGKECKCEKKE